MSWIFGAFDDRIDPRFERRLAAIHPSGYTLVRTPRLYVACGGLSETIRAGRLEGSSSIAEGGWIVVGIGMEVRDGRSCFLSASDWSRILSAPHPDLRRLDGHFAVVRWRDGALDCFVDQLGMRTLYIARSGSAVVFSTRLGWVTGGIDRADIDFTQLGSHWLLLNQLLPTSMVSGVMRLGPGGTARCASDDIVITDTPWTLPIDESRRSDVVARLRAFLRPRLDDGASLSLGLSGGIDSRVLLALLSGRDFPFSTWLMGNDTEPDVIVSKRIARAEELDQIRLDDPVPEAGQLIPLLERYSAETCAVESASGILNLRYFHPLHARGLVMVDGGMGEIGRRHYLKRLLISGRSAMRSRDPKAIFQYLSASRTNPFTPEATETIRAGALREIESVWSGFPDIDAVGAENIADLLIVRTRFPNYAGRVQTWTDSAARSFMPFAQPSVIALLMSLPPSDPRCGRLYRELVRAHRPALARFPMVKDGMSYPFGFSPIMAWLYRKARRRIGTTGTVRPAAIMLGRLEEYIRDLVASREVREFPAYDYPRLAAMVDRYYTGDCTRELELDWWLSFELWRQSLVHPS